MVAPRRSNEAVGDLLQTDLKELQAKLASQMQGMGYNPFRNRFAQQVMNRAGEAQLLGNLKNVGSGGIENFANEWLQARLGSSDGGGGGGGQYGDLSRGGIKNWLGGAMANNDPNSDIYKMLNTGDFNADLGMLGAVQGLANQGNSPLLQQAQQRMLDQWGVQARSATQDNADLGNRSIMDLYLGRSPAAQPGFGAQPPGATPSLQPGQPGADQRMYLGGTPNFNEATGQYQPTPSGYGQSASGPQGSLTPPLRQPGAQPGGVTNWNQLLDKYRSDQRNWGTEGFRPNAGAFTIGGMKYDPAQDQVTNWENMSGSGRTTHRGNFMSQFMYTLQQLMNQRARGGNAALGFGGQATDDELARIAWQRLQKNIGGQSSGFSAVG